MALDAAIEPLDIRDAPTRSGIKQLHALFSRYASLTGGDEVVNEVELRALYAAEPPRGLGREFQTAEESFAVVSEWGNEYVEFILFYPYFI